MILKYVVKEDGKTINQIVKNNFQLSVNLLNKLIKNNNIYVNGINRDTRNIAIKDDIIEINLEYEEDSSSIISKKMELNIVYEDENMVILNKPAGIPVHPSMLHFEDTLANGVKYYFEKQGIHKKIRAVNRLDLNTSGLIIFAKNEYIQEKLIRQMKHNIFKKEYIAIVSGKVENDEGTINAPIARKEKSIIERCVEKNGQKAVTEYEVLKRKEQYSIVKCKLITGRTHQIRVHFAYIGHPILGDTLYGTSSKFIDRQALHCYKMEFLDPVSEKKISIEADLPSELMKFLI